MRNILFGILFFSGFISGYAQIDPDSSALFYQSQPVEIVEERLPAPNSLSHSSLNFLNQVEYQTHDLATYLDRKGMAQINMNGAAGSAASIRFRGTSSDHTTLFWKGFSINSVSLGSADLSMIPVFFMDKATVMSSPGALHLPGSNIGAGIDLISSAQYLKSGNIRLVGSYNTLDNSFYGIDIPLRFSLGKASEENGQKFYASQLHIRTKVFDQHLNNNFLFVDKYQFERPRVEQHHNNGRANGALNEISLLHGAHRLEFSNWYQRKRMNLPAIMGMIAPGEAEQSDQLMRSSLSYNYSGDKTNLGFSTAYFNDATHYRDELNSEGNWAIDSKIHSRGILSRINIIHKHKKFKFLADALSSYYNVQNVSYRNGSIRKHWGQVGGSVLYQIRPLHQLMAGVRYDIRDMQTKPSFSLNYKLLKKSSGQIPFLEVQISKSYRPADLNERFWYPGGNPGLRPEEGMNYMINSGIEYKTGKFELISKAGLFYNDITDWIQWIPQTGNIWSPVNFKRVRSAGIELPVTAAYKFNEIFLQSEIRYTYTDSRGINSNEWNGHEDFVMIYSPAHVLFAEFQLHCRDFGFGIHNKFTSSRFTDELNSTLRALESYQITGAYISGKLKIKDNEMECRFSADNLFNVSYESVRAYAMPGRVLQLSLNYLIGINQTKNK